jgi:hypothetical protein
LSQETSEEAKILKEILKWIRFAGLKEVKAVLISELDTDQKKQVYQLSDGSKARAELVKLTGVSAGAISGYWKKWANLGLGEKLAVRGGERFARAFDLEDFSIAVLEPKEQNTEQKDIHKPINHKT